MVTAAGGAGPATARGRLLAWRAALVAVVLGADAAGAVLPAPPLTDVGAWGQWLAGRDPVLVAFGVLRLAVLVAAYYLLAVTVVGALARAARWRRAVAVADVVTLPAVRRLLSTAVHVSVATATLVPSPAFAAPPPGPPPPRPAATATADPAADTAGEDRRSLRPSHHDGPLTAAVDAAVDAARRGAAQRDAAGRGATAPEPAPRSHPAPPVEPTWRVRPGESFWTIAERTVRRAAGAAATDEQVTAYWHQLVERNHAALADRDNPDLIYPGQVFNLPPPR